MSRDDLSPIEEPLEEMFRKMGLPDPLRMSQLVGEWDDLAGEPWRGRSRPETVKGGALIVRANSPSMVAFLRYGAADLLTRLEQRFGHGFISTIEVRPPTRLE